MSYSLIRSFLTGYKIQNVAIANQAYYLVGSSRLTYKVMTTRCHCKDCSVMLSCISVIQENITPVLFLHVLLKHSAVIFESNLNKITDTYLVCD